jgi:hypothetical protein
MIAVPLCLLGSFIFKPFLLLLKPAMFRLIMDGIMLAACVSLLYPAATS